MQAARPATLPRAPGAPSAARARPERLSGALRLGGAAGLLALLTSLLLLVLDAAQAPSRYVPADSGGWPGWLAGPLAGAGSHLGSAGFQVLVLVACGAFAVVLASARAIPLRWLAAGVVAAHVIVALGPPLISQDAFGYIAFARMGALHGLDPYTHFPAEASSDPVFGFIGWPFQHSPYGPLFTLASYVTAPLGLAGALWTLKVLTAVCSLGAVWLTARAAARLGRSAAFATVFLGLNPVLLILAVGGAHNDTLVILALAAGLALSAAARPRGAALALAAGVGVKLTAGLVLPFLVLGERQWRRRLEVALAGALGLVAVAVVGVIGFGPHALGFLTAIGEQQQLVATHSIPAETARLLGIGSPTHPVPDWWRQLWAAGFLIVLVYALWRTARGAEWRAAAGWATLALLLSTAWLLPWYAIWPLPLAAVSGDRRLRAAALVLCAYAVLIHLPLADPLLSPKRPHVRVVLPPGTPGIPRLNDRLEFSGFEVLRDVRLDFRF
jgi:hypothetical protein